MVRKDASLSSPSPMAVRASKFTAAVIMTSAFLLTLHAEQSTPALTTIAGNGIQGFSDGGGSPLDSSFYLPHGISIDRAGNLLVADYLNHRIRLITQGQNPRISTFAGNGMNDLDARFSEGVDPTTASLAYPWSTAVDSSGNVYIADSWHNCIRKVTPGANPTISTVAAFCHALNFGFGGDGRDPLDATFNYPTALAFDKGGSLYVADSNNQRIRKITFGTNPMITTVVGTGDVGNSLDAVSLGDGGDPKNAKLSVPYGLGFDSLGNLYIADTGHNRIRKVTFGDTSSITTVAGDGTTGDTGYFQNVGDGGNPLQAHIYAPNSIAIDSADHLFIGDTAHGLIRKVVFEGHPVITTVAGSVQSFDPNSSDPLQAGFIGAYGLAIDQDGNTYIADQNNTIRLLAGVAEKKARYAQNISVSLTSNHLTYPGSTNVVIAVAGTPTPTGTVDLYDGSSKLATVYLQGDGKAYWYIQPGLSAGPHAISARYNGDSMNPVGQSAPVTVNVDPVPVNFAVACWSGSEHRLSRHRNRGLSARS